MLRINPQSSAAKATRYYTGAPSSHEYYSVDAALQGEWAGLAASKLGLEGPVRAAAFLALAQNLHPTSRDRLTVRNKANRTVGYDFTFDPPKSVSIAYAINDDRRLAALFREAVRTTMQLAEADASTRVRIGGQDTNRPTGNLVWAEFVHEMTRPVDGLPDPQLHCHCFVFNVTHDPVEQRWKAAQFRELKRNAPYYQAVFNATFAALLERAGYELDRKGLSYELAGFTPEMIAKYSRRTRQIEDAAKRKGIINPDIKSTLGARTREEKTSGILAQELRTEWQSRLTPDELQRVNLHRDVRPRELPPPDPLLLSRALEYAKAHCFERLSVVDQHMLMTAALRYGEGRLNPAQVRRAVESDTSLVRRETEGRSMVTTPELIAEETTLVEWVKRGHGTMRPLAPGPHSQLASLPQELRDAARHILESRDRVTGVRGRAGTGKTTLMRTTIDLIEESGHRVVVLAPTAETARGTLREHKFENANTVAHLLANEWPQKEAAGAVWWVDEAGLQSLREMSALMALAERLGARIILSGDTGQHRSVQRGDALRILLEHAGLSLAQVRTIRRQSGEYRESVEAIADNRLADAFQKLDSMGAIVEMAGLERHDLVADKYVEHYSQGESVLVVSPTHSEGRKVTRLIRDRLLASRQLHSEVYVPQLRRVDLHVADIRRSNSYKPGMVLEMVKPAPGHDTGRRFEVDAVLDEEVYVRHPDASRRFFDIAAWSDRFHVYQKAELALAVGDRVRITKSGYDNQRLPLNNGSLHTITAITPHGDIELDNGRYISRDFSHLEHGYVTTSYAAQSKTVKHVIVAESTESLPAASREQFYVSVSRGQVSATIVTDDKEALLESIQASSQRTAALDLASSRKFLCDKLGRCHLGTLTRSRVDTATPGQMRLASKPTLG